jgi:hypothetical protein
VGEPTRVSPDRDEPKSISEPPHLLIVWQQVSSWLSSEIVWTSQPTERHAEVLGNLLALPGEHGNLVPDTHLAALANEHGLTLCSTDGDFARFPGLTWCDQALPPAISSRRIVIVEARPGPRMIATAGTGGRGANSSVQREPSTALAYEGYAKQSFGLSSLSSVLRLRRAKTAYKFLTLLFDQLHQLLSLQLL